MDEKEMTMREALNLALDQALAADDRVFLLGEDIADPGASGPDRGAVDQVRHTTACSTRRSRRPRSSALPSARPSTACCRWPRS